MMKNFVLSHLPESMLSATASTPGAFWLPVQVADVSAFVAKSFVSKASAVNSLASPI